MSQSDVLFVVNRTDGYKSYVMKRMPIQRDIDSKEIGKGKLLEKIE